MPISSIFRQKPLTMGQNHSFLMEFLYFKYWIFVDFDRKIARKTILKWIKIKILPKNRIKVIFRVNLLKKWPTVRVFKEIYKNLAILNKYSSKFCLFWPIVKAKIWQSPSIAQFSVTMGQNKQNLDKTLF